MALKPRKQTKIEARLAKLEREMVKMKSKISKSVTPKSVKRKPKTRKEIKEYLLAKGVIRLPSAEELAIAAEWDAIPEEERKQFTAKLQSLKLEPPLSESNTHRDSRISHPRLQRSSSPHRRQSGRAFNRKPQ